MSKFIETDSYIEGKYGHFSKQFNDIFQSSLSRLTQDTITGTVPSHGDWTLESAFQRIQHITESKLVTHSAQGLPQHGLFSAVSKHTPEKTTPTPERGPNKR